MESTLSLTVRVRDNLRGRGIGVRNNDYICDVTPLCEISMKQNYLSPVCEIVRCYAGDLVVCASPNGVIDPWDYNPDDDIPTF